MITKTTPLHFLFFNLIFFFFTIPQNKHIVIFWQFSEKPGAP